MELILGANVLILNPRSALRTFNAVLYELNKVAKSTRCTTYVASRNPVRKTVRTLITECPERFNEIEIVCTLQTELAAVVGCTRLVITLTASPLMQQWCPLQRAAWSMADPSYYHLFRFDKVEVAWRRCGSGRSPAQIRVLGLGERLKDQMGDVFRFGRTVLRWLGNPDNCSGFVAKCDSPRLQLSMEGVNAAAEPWCRESQIEDFDAGIYVGVLEGDPDLVFFGRDGQPRKDVTGDYVKADQIGSLCVARRVCSNDIAEEPSCRVSVPFIRHAAVREEFGRFLAENAYKVGENWLFEHGAANRLRDGGLVERLPREDVGMPCLLPKWAVMLGIDLDRVIEFIVNHQIADLFTKVVEERIDEMGENGMASGDRIIECHVLGMVSVGIRKDLAEFAGRSLRMAMGRGRVGES